MADKNGDEPADAPVVKTIKDLIWDAELKLIQSRQQDARGRISVELDEAFLQGRLHGLKNALGLLREASKVEVKRAG